jgi:thymidylate kinase
MSALESLLASLDRHGVRWTLLRPRETVGLGEGDVDLLVEPGSVARVRAILVEQGFVLLPMPGEDVHAVFYDEHAGRFEWIHLQASLRLAGAVLPAAAVLEGAGMQAPDDWLLWILLLRALVDKGHLPERHRPHVQALAQRWRGGPREMVELARRHGLEPRAVVGAAAAGDWRQLLGQRVKPAPAAPAWAAWPARALRAAINGRGPGLTVAVIGPDGAGKTTLVEGLAESIPMPTRILYMGLTGGRLPRADALRVPGLVLLARLTLLWARYAVAAYHRSRGRIVLFNRYTLNGAVPSGVPRSRTGRKSRRFQRRAIPSPDVVLLLDASGETMHARKGEYTPQELEIWRGAYRRLAPTITAFEIIDAERPAAEVLDVARAHIWRHFAQRHGGHP